MRMRLVSFVLLVALLLPGCFFTAERGHLLEQRVQKLMQENETLGLEMKESQERISKALDQTEQWARQSGANIGVQMQRSADDIASLRGALELLEHRLGQLEKAHAATQNLVATALAPAAAPSTASLTTSVTTASSPASTTLPAAPKPNEPKAFLKHTDEVLKKNIKEAQALLNEFLRRWPKDSAVGEVHFKLGETYFSQKQYREALYEYGKVIQEFPKTTSAPLTYLRSSECFKQLKKLPESKLALEELVRVHPKSTEAKKGAELLKNIEETEKKAKEKKPGK